jgi:hypothetical protein
LMICLQTLGSILTDVTIAWCDVSVLMTFPKWRLDWRHRSQWVGRLAAKWEWRISLLLGGGSSHVMRVDGVTCAKRA